MKLFLWRIVMFIGTLLLILGIITISLALVLGFAIGVGWVLTLFLPFTLFEGSLLGLLTSIIVGTIWYNFLGSILGFEAGEGDSDQGYVDYDGIPASKFYKTKADRTWETWIRYQLANGIYVEFQDSPQPVAPMGDKQLQELAIRLADISVSLLKTKTVRAKRLKITMPALKRQMAQMGQRPYDDNILRLAVTAINEDLDYHYEDIMEVIRSKLWEQPSDMFGWQ